MVRVMAVKLAILHCQLLDARFPSIKNHWKKCIVSSQVATMTPLPGYRERLKNVSVKNV